MNLSNIKATLSTIAGILGGVSVALLTLVGSLAQYAIVLPDWVNITAGVCGGLSVAILGILQGRNPNGTSKTVTQVVEANTKAAETKE
jgi:hypothetical protein